MIGILPFPMASAGVLILWLLLHQSLSPGHILLGSVAGVVGGWSLAALQVPKTSIRRFGAVCRLLALVVTDIVLSNIAVGRIILRLQRRPWTSGFVEIPLDLRNPYGLAALACIITSTPGTVWADFDATRGMLTIHVLDLVDKAEWVRTIKGRYERHLLVIFE
jgi:multicomponent K+:H+ antiporter subunit E